MVGKMKAGQPPANTDMPKGRSSKGAKWTKGAHEDDELKTERQARRFKCLGEGRGTGQW